MFLFKFIAFLNPLLSNLLIKHLSSCSLFLIFDWLGVIVEHGIVLDLLKEISCFIFLFTFLLHEVFLVPLFCRLHSFTNVFFLEVSVESLLVSFEKNWLLLRESINYSMSWQQLLILSLHIFLIFLKRLCLLLFKSWCLLSHSLSIMVL